MNHDEFAFFNQQLAALLREGIPLEGALGQLSREMRHGKTRAAIRQVEGELRNGTPLDQAVAKAELPGLYQELVRLGAVSGDLPGALTMAADYYRRVGAIWTRLRGLLTYPLLVLLLSLAMSVWFVVVFRKVHADFAGAVVGAPNLVSGLVGSGNGVIPEQAGWWLNLWIPPVIMTALVVGMVTLLSIGSIRERLRWRLGPFKDASLAQLAASLQMLLRQGVPLRQSLAFGARMESASAAKDLRRWMERHAEGHARFNEIAAGSKIVPPMFIWIVAGAGEDIATGFADAAEFYGERARRRAELLLNLVLPCALLALGLMVMGQVQPFMTSVFDLFTPVFKAQQVIGP